MFFDFCHAIRRIRVFNFCFSTPRVMVFNFCCCIRRILVLPMILIPILAAILGICNGELQNPDLQVSQYNEIVVIPDIHGDLEAMLRSLWLALKKINSEEEVVAYGEFISAFLGFLRTRK